MKFKPLQDWVLIKSLEPEEKTAGGIFIPESAKDKPTEGIVLAVGPGRFKTEEGKEKEKKKEKKFVPTVLSPGQRIAYGKYSATEVELEGATVVLVREEDVLGFFEDTSLVEKKAFAVVEKKEKPVALNNQVKPVSAVKKTGKKKGG